MNKVLFSSNSVDWSTPIWLFNILDHKFHFNVDLCASDSNHLCDIYYSLENSCFNCDLEGYSIFCNPPYSRNMYSFISKCYDLSKKNKVVMLLPARTDTRWFHDFIYHKSEIVFLKGRLKFGGSKGSAPFPSMVVIYD